MSEQEIKVKMNPGEGALQPEESQVAAEESAQLKKLSADLDDLRQTLLRRQADFDNYRKRIEKERA